MVTRALARLNARHPWSHNDHFHGWLLRSLPPGRGAALDVGCGDGLLLRRLAPHFGSVIGVDPDSDAVVRAREAGVPTNASLRVGTLADAARVAGGVDLVTMVAVLHHLDLRTGLEHAADLLRPGGRFLCVGLSRVEGPVDAVWEAVNAVTNPLIGMVKHPRVRRGGDRERMITAEPTESLARIRSVGEQVMPGVRIRRRQGFRHTMEWTKPG